MRHKRLEKILKISSIKGLSLAKGLNFSYAERLGVKDREELLSSKELFGQDILNAVNDIIIPADVAKILNAFEKQYVELLEAKHLVDMDGTAQSLELFFNSDFFIGLKSSPFNSNNHSLS